MYAPLVPIIEAPSLDALSDLLPDYISVVTAASSCLSFLFPLLLFLFFVYYASSQCACCSLFLSPPYMSLCPMWNGHNWSDGVVWLISLQRVAVTLLIQFVITYKIKQIHREHNEKVPPIIIFVTPLIQDELTCIATEKYTIHLFASAFGESNEYTTFSTELYTWLKNDHFDNWFFSLYWICIDPYKIKLIFEHF